jgi:hypothetical protein
LTGVGPAEVLEDDPQAAPMAAIATSQATEVNLSAEDLIKDTGTVL